MRRRFSQRGLRTALAVALVAAAAVPVVASADSGALDCGHTTVSGDWQRVPVAPFPGVQGLTSTDTLTSYAIDTDRPTDQAATNGTVVLLSSSRGCDWQQGGALALAPSTAQPYSGATATITALARSAGHVVAAVRVGSGAASTPHVLVRSNGALTSGDSGLPVAGAPGLLRAAPGGGTVYLTIDPVGGPGSGTGGGGGVMLPGLPVGGGTAQRAGLLYASDDGGSTWSLRTAAGALPGGQTALSALAVDAGDATTLYGLAGGDLLVSHDGGASFAAAGGTGGRTFTTLTALDAGSVLAADTSGHGVVVTGTSVHPLAVPGGVTSLAFRNGDGRVLTESSGTLRLVDTSSGAATLVPPGASVTTGSASGERVAGATFHVQSGHALLRFVDPVARGQQAPPPVAADASTRPPAAGTVAPASQTVTLPVGSSALEPFTLALPKNRTPLELFFLVDDSGSEEDYIDQLKRGILAITASLERQSIDLKVGVGTLGTGPGHGEAPYPTVEVGTRCTGAAGLKECQDYRKPTLYHLLSTLQRPGSGVQRAVNAVQVETPPYNAAGSEPPGREGQLLALEQAVNGAGANPTSIGGLTSYDVAPGQEAGFHDAGGARHLVVLSSDEEFDDPVGSPEKNTRATTSSHDNLDFAHTIGVLGSRGVKVFGLTTENGAQSHDDLVTLARGTKTFAPPGGVDCDSFIHLPAGAPLVCDSGSNFAQIIPAVVAALADRQSLSAAAPFRTPVLGSIDLSAGRGLDVTRANTVPFTVGVTCAGVRPGTYTQPVQALLRGYVVGRATVRVTCVRAAAAVAPRVVSPPGSAPAQGAPAPPVQPPAGTLPVVAPPAPAVQPQAQPQTQVQTQVQTQAQAQAQLNPMTSGALQEQQELQLALAYADPSSDGTSTLAMVDRRRRQEVQALGVLAFAMTACAGLGLARLRGGRAAAPAPQRR